MVSLRVGGVGLVAGMMTMMACGGVPKPPALGGEGSHSEDEIVGGDDVVVFDHSSPAPDTSPPKKKSNLVSAPAELKMAVSASPTGAAGSGSVSVSVSSAGGKSCEKVIAENPEQVVVMTGSSRDLSADELGKPLGNGAFLQSCGLAESTTADVCVAVKKGKPIGVTVRVSPANPTVAACIDRAARKLSFPASDKLDIVREHF